MDYQTVNTSDMHTCDLLRGDAEKRGQTVTFTHDPAQKWYYLDQQRTDEVTVIKIWDNSKDPGISKCTCNPAVSKGTFTYFYSLCSLGFQQSKYAPGRGAEGKRGS